MGKKAPVIGISAKAPSSRASVRLRTAPCPHRWLRELLARSCGPRRMELVQERSDEEAAERERSEWERVAAQQEDRARKPDENPLAWRRSLAASGESESTDRGHPAQRSDDAEGERRPECRPVFDD